MKKGFLNKIVKGLKPVFRGIFKSIPGVNPIIEIVQNVRNEIKKTHPVVNGEPVCHNWISIVIQLASVGVIIYAFCKKLVTVDQVLELLNKIVE